MKKYVIFILLIFTSQILLGQTTGKVAGRITDKDTGEPVMGANVVILDTYVGAATDMQGDYYIINVPPGVYDIKVSMIGYTPLIFQDVAVSVNRTSTLNGEMATSALEMDAVVVSVESVSHQKDKTGTVKNVSSEDISNLAVEDVSDVVEMQAGVVKGHFRGGRSTEVSHMVDGVPVTNSYDQENSSVVVETEAVQDLEVITGTFNAEYGRAMSGIVNMVTKDGSDEFHGNATVYLSNYLTGNDDIFIGLGDDVYRNSDIKFQLSGPVYKDKITFFMNSRYTDQLGYLNGIRYFNMDDYSNFSNADYLGSVTTPWDAVVDGDKYYSEHTGDGDYVAMNTNEQLTYMGKLTFKLFNDLKFSLMYSHNESEYLGYDHDYKYAPDGQAKDYSNSDFFLFSANHMISNKMFHNFRASYNSSENETYLYKDPYDSRYVSDNYGSDKRTGFYTGGQEKGYKGVTLKDLNIKYDLTWQANKHHSFKTGFVYIGHDLTNETLKVRDVKYGSSEYYEYYYDSDAEKIVFNDYEAEVLDSAVSSENYNKKPVEFSAYLQDKMEFNELVINYGVRYDMFDAKSKYPSNLRNPGNQLSYPDNPERMSEYKDAEIQQFFSPRFGLSYTLSDAAVLHFSYGHFYQMPPLYALYQNSRFLIPSGDYDTVLGNASLKAEKTVQYQMGIWQEITDNMGVEVSIFYRDIYDLLSTKIVTTYNSIKYGVYTNKDYGNSKGLEVKWDYAMGPLALFANYTLMYTRGVADNPKTTFNRAGDSMDPISKLIAMEWDQRHTFNFNIAYTQKNYNASLMAYYGSGQAYSHEPISDSRLYNLLLYPNNQYQPSTFKVDFKGSYKLNMFKKIDAHLYLIVYNVFDKLNEVSVNSATGRAYTTILTSSEMATFTSNYNDIYDSYQDPSMYSAPREIKVGIGFNF